MQRQAATPKGLFKRIRDLHLERLHDPRSAPQVRYPLPTLVSGLLAAMVSAASSLRDVERRTFQIGKKLPDWLGIKGRIADNTFGKMLSRLNVSAVVKRQHELVKAEQRRGNLEPTQLPLGVGAIDGKNIATLYWHDLCRVLKLDVKTADPQAVKKKLQEKFPDLQLCIPTEGLPYALARVHTVTLISSAAAVGLHQRPIPGDTNEIGALPDVLKELHHAYGRTGLLQMLTTDAGNTSLKVAGQIVETYHLDYFCQFKSEHGDLHVEAERALGRRSHAQADATLADSQNGCSVVYHVWTQDLSGHGWLKWKHARQLVRVERITENARTGEKTTGNRYYVCSRPPEKLSAKEALAVSRAHWRCEDETHWTADVVLNEDRRRLAWSRHPNGVFVVAALRMMALTILAIARKLSRIGYSRETPTWAQVMEHFLLALGAETLLTEEFDAVAE